MVDVRVTLDVVVGRGDPHSARDVDVAEVDAVWSCHLFKCKPKSVGSSATRRWTSYHSMHADNSYRKAHRFFDGGVDQHQVVESRFGPVAVVGLENIITLFSEFFDEVYSIGRVKQVEESVSYGL